MVFLHGFQFFPEPSYKGDSGKKISESGSDIWSQESVSILFTVVQRPFYRGDSVGFFLGTVDWQTWRLLMARICTTLRS